MQMSNVFPSHLVVQPIHSKNCQNIGIHGHPKQLLHSPRNIFFKNQSLSVISQSLTVHCKYVQWNYSGSAFKKTVILNNYRSLLLTYVRCIFYKLKIVILTLFSCSLFCIELNVHITSFHCF